MVSFGEIIFLISFILCVGITLTRLYNLMNGFKIFAFVTQTMFYIGYLLSWGICFITFLINSENTLMMMLFSLTSFLLMFNTMIFIIEWLKTIQQAAAKNNRYFGRS